MVTHTHEQPHRSQLATCKHVCMRHSPYWWEQGSLSWWSHFQGAASMPSAELVPPSQHCICPGWTGSYGEREGSTRHQTQQWSKEDMVGGKWDMQEGGRSSEGVMEGRGECHWTALLSTTHTQTTLRFLLHGRHVDVAHAHREVDTVKATLQHEHLS